MIENRKQLNEYITEEKKLYDVKAPIFIGKETLKYQIALRKLEYYSHKVERLSGKMGGVYLIPYVFYKCRHHYLGIKLGFDIPIDVFGKGLIIHHYGSIQVNGNARVGKNCSIQQGVVIGQNGTGDDVPVIGNNVYIGAGAKIIGKIRIADNVAIGANAVVNRSFENENMAIAGVPAKEIGRRKEKLY